MIFFSKHFFLRKWFEKSFFFGQAKKQTLVFIHEKHKFFIFCVPRKNELRESRKLKKSTNSLFFIDFFSLTISFFIDSFFNGFFFFFRSFFSKVFFLFKKEKLFSKVFFLFKKEKLFSKVFFLFKKEKLFSKVFFLFKKEKLLTYYFDVVTDFFFWLFLRRGSANDLRAFNAGNYSADF